MNTDKLKALLSVLTRPAYIQFVNDLSTLFEVKTFTDRNNTVPYVEIYSDKQLKQVMEATKIYLQYGDMDDVFVVYPG